MFHKGRSVVVIENQTAIPVGWVGTIERKLKDKMKISFERHGAPAQVVTLPSQALSTDIRSHGDAQVASLPPDESSEDGSASALQPNANLYPLEFLPGKGVQIQTKITAEIDGKAWLLEEVQGRVRDTFKTESHWRPGVT